MGNKLNIYLDIVFLWVYINIMNTINIVRIVNYLRSDSSQNV